MAERGLSGSRVTAVMMRSVAIPRNPLYIWEAAVLSMGDERKREKVEERAREGERERERKHEREGGRTGGRWKAATRSWGASVLFLPCPRSSPVSPLRAAMTRGQGRGERTSSVAVVGGYSRSLLSRNRVFVKGDVATYDDRSSRECVRRYVGDRRSWEKKIKVEKRARVRQRYARMYVHACTRAETQV